jgi:hypothetical protein
VKVGERILLRKNEKKIKVLLVLCVRVRVSISNKNPRAKQADTTLWLQR